MLVSSASPSWLLILRRSQKTSLNGVPAYIQIDPSQLFTKRELYLELLIPIDHQNVVSFASDFNTGFMPYGNRYITGHSMLC